MKDHWRISELRFYDDKECEIPLKVASGEYIFSSIYHGLTEDLETTLADDLVPDMRNLMEETNGQVSQTPISVYLFLLI